MHLQIQRRDGDLTVLHWRLIFNLEPKRLSDTLHMEVQYM